MTTLHITIGEREQARNDALEFVEEADGTGDDRAVLQFGSYGDLITNLTPTRLELLEVIATDEPESIREAARLIDRDVSDVHGDLKRLEVLNVLEFRAGGPGGAMQPVVPFDRVEIHVDYPLREDSNDATESAAD